LASTNRPELSTSEVVYSANMASAVFPFVEKLSVCLKKIISKYVKRKRDDKNRWRKEFKSTRVQVLKVYKLIFFGKEP